MKKYVTLFTFISLCSGVLTQAQTLKFGHINTQELMNLMPERDSAVVRLQKYEDELQETLVGINTEYQTKYAEYQQKQDTWTSLVLETKARELVEIRQRFETFNQNAPEEFAAQQNREFAPIYEKAQNAIQKVAKELGLIFVFDSSGMPYIDENQSVHLLDLVKAELKIPADKVSPTPLDGLAQR